MSLYFYGYNCVYTTSQLESQFFLALSCLFCPFLKEPVFLPKSVKARGEELLFLFQYLSELSITIDCQWYYWLSLYNFAESGNFYIFFGMTIFKECMWPKMLFNCLITFLFSFEMNTISLNYLLLPKQSLCPDVR